MHWTTRMATPSKVRAVLFEIELAVEGVVDPIRLMAHALEQRFATACGP
jgi:hypothetical protein